MMKRRTLKVRNTNRLDQIKSKNKPGKLRFEESSKRTEGNVTHDSSALLTRNSVSIAIASLAFFRNILGEQSFHLLPVKKKIIKFKTEGGNGANMFKERIQDLSVLISKRMVKYFVIYVYTDQSDAMKSFVESYEFSFFYNDKMSLNSKTTVDKQNLVKLWAVICSQIQSIVTKLKPIPSTRFIGMNYFLFKDRIKNKNVPVVSGYKPLSSVGKKYAFSDAVPTVRLPVGLYRVSDFHSFRLHVRINSTKMAKQRLMSTTMSQMSSGSFI